MDHPRLVGRYQPFHNGPHDLESLRNRDLAVTLEDAQQVLAFDEGHGDVLDTLDLTDVMDAYHILVSHLTCQEQLAFEAPVELFGDSRILRHLRPDHLESDRDVEYLVPGLVDRSHASETE